MRDRGPEVVAVATSFLVLSWVVVSARCYVRIRLKPPFRISDALAVTSLLVAVYQGGLGKHMSTLSPDTISIGVKYLLLFELSYLPATTLVKLSIGLFLLQFTTNRAQTYTIYCALAVNIIFGIFVFFFALFQCRPVSEFWLRENHPPHGSCMNPDAVVKVSYAQATILSATDWTFAIVPIFIVRKLSLNFRTKCYIAIILGLGSIAVLATIARFPSIRALTSSDFLYNVTNLVIFSYIEVAIALIASSAATCRPLLTEFKRWAIQIRSDPVAEPASV